MLFSIGHSSITIEQFINTLKNFHIDILYDSRGIPYSGYVAQFNMENLKANLQKNNIKYIHSKCLNGIDTYKNSDPTPIMLQELNNITLSSKDKNAVIMGCNANYKLCHRYKLCNWIHIYNTTIVNHIILDSNNIVAHSPYPMQSTLF